MVVRRPDRGEMDRLAKIHLSGARELETLIILKGDNPAADDIVRQRVMECHLLALGAPAKGHAPNVRLLHCTVPVGDSTIAMLPVFTRPDHVAAAVRMNPAWQSLQVIEMEGNVIMSDLEPDEWLGINPWSGREFKLPAV